MTEARWNIQLHGNDLLWQPTEETPIWRNYRLDEGEPFFSFKELGESFSEVNVLRFAKMWGPLGICRCPPGRFLTHGAEYGWGLEGKPVFHPDAPEGQRIKFKNKLDFWIKSPVRCSWRRIELGGKTWFAESLI